MDSREGTEADASRLLRVEREVWSNRPSAGDECMPGRADNLSELVRLDPDDSESYIDLDGDHGERWY